MTDEAKEIDEELLNAKCVFGLKAQGHIPTIEAMLAEGAPWEVIARKIGWLTSTMVEHYARYLRQDRDRLAARVAELERMLCDYRDNYDCDTGANGLHSRVCRCCAAEAALAQSQPDTGTGKRGGAS